MQATTIEIGLTTNKNQVNTVNNHKFIIPINKKYPLTKKIKSMSQGQFITSSIEHYQIQSSITNISNNQSIEYAF